MTIPNLPTDNLYKFMALVGLAGVVVLPIYLTQHWYEVRAKIIENNGRFDLLRMEAEYLVEDMNVAHGTSVEKNDPEVRLGEEKYKSLIREKNLKLKELRNNEELLKSMLLEQETNYWVGMATILICVGLSTAGFTFWYNRIQKHQDHIIKREAEKKS